MGFCRRSTLFTSIFHYLDCSPTIQEAYNLSLGEQMVRTAVRDSSMLSVCPLDASPAYLTTRLTNKHHHSDGVRVTVLAAEESISLGPAAVWYDSLLFTFMYSFYSSIEAEPFIGFSFSHFGSILIEI